MFVDLIRSFLTVSKLLCAHGAFILLSSVSSDVSLIGKHLMTTWIPAMEIVSLRCDDPHWNLQLVSTVPCLNLRVHSQSLGTPQQRHQTEAVLSLNGLAPMSAATYWTLDRAAERHMCHVSLKTPAMLWVPTGRAPCQAFSGCLQSSQTPADKVKRWTERWAGGIAAWTKYRMSRETEGRMVGRDSL